MYFLSCKLIFLPFSRFHSSPIWHYPEVQNVQMNQWQAWHSISGNSHRDSKWHFMLLESEHSSEDPGICLQTTLKIEIFVAAVKKATLDHFKSDLSNFSYKDKGILKKKILISLKNVLQRISKQRVFCIYSLQRNVAWCLWYKCSMQICINLST